MKNFKKAVKNNDIIFFDGVCNYCNGFVRFLIKNDPQEKFRFSSLQSPFAQSIFLEKGLKKNLTTIVFIKENQVYFKSTAIIEILYMTKYRFFGFAIKILPMFIRDLIYDFVASKRYSIFGRTEECVVPDKKINHLFFE